jgi:hypothetical protein
LASFTPRGNTRRVTHAWAREPTLRYAAARDSPEKLVVRELPASEAFYTAIFQVLQVHQGGEGDDYFWFAPSVTISF